MEKPAETAYPIEELLKRRWSPRAFADCPVETEKLLSLWEASRWSASTANQRPRLSSNANWRHGGASQPRASCSRARGGRPRRRSRRIKQDVV
jgi:hypothetical protein